MSQTSENIDKNAQNRARRSMVLIALLFFTPFVGAWVLFFYFPEWQPLQHNNHGTLITPVQMTPSVELQTLDDKVFAWDNLRGQKKWTMVHHIADNCDEVCWKNNYKMRQTHAALTKYSHKVQRALLISNPEKLTEQAKLSKAYPGMYLLKGDQIPSLLAILDSNSSDKNKIYLIDHLGYFMMEYSVDADPIKIHKDLNRLLKYAPDTK
jgi:cytochrome oxidase Cu insertion factor (SCO1/SenC/PrrC family)